MQWRNNSVGYSTLSYDLPFKVEVGVKLISKNHCKFLSQTFTEGLHNQPVSKHQALKSMQNNKTIRLQKLTKIWLQKQ